MVTSYNPSKPAGTDVELASASSRQQQPRAPPPASYPYRRGITCVLRGFFGTFSAAMIAFSIILMDSQGLGNNIPKTTFIAPIAAFALSFVLNYFALISAILRRYGPKGYWKLMVFVEPVVLAFGIWGFVTFAYQIDGDVKPEETVNRNGKMVLDDSKPVRKDLMADMCMLVGVLHVAAAIGGLWGMKLVSLRRKSYETKGTPHFSGVKVLAWTNPVRSGGVAHTGYPEPGN